MATFVELLQSKPRTDGPAITVVRVHAPERDVYWLDVVISTVAGQNGVPNIVAIPTQEPQSNDVLTLDDLEPDDETLEEIRDALGAQDWQLFGHLIVELYNDRS